MTNLLNLHLILLLVLWKNYCSLLLFSHLFKSLLLFQVIFLFCCRIFSVFFLFRIFSCICDHLLQRLLIVSLKLFLDYLTFNLLGKLVHRAAFLRILKNILDLRKIVDIILNSWLFVDTFSRKSFRNIAHLNFTLHGELVFGQIFQFSLHISLPIELLNLNEVFALERHLVRHPTNHLSRGSLIPRASQISLRLLYDLLHGALIIRNFLLFSLEMVEIPQIIKSFFDLKLASLLIAIFIWILTAILTFKGAFGLFLVRRCEIFASCTLILLSTTQWI